MKPKINILAVIIISGLIFAGITASAEEKTKQYNESWPVKSVETLEISNRFGEIKVVDNGGKDVTVDVVVTVEASSEKKADELLELIDVSFGKTGNTVSAQTHIRSNFNSNKRFSINYEVNIPPDKNLNITNKYGNTFINVLNANGSFDIQYGNITVNELNTPESGSAELKLSYGKSDIEKAKDLNVTVQYSNMNFGMLNDLDLNSKYTVINIEKVGSVKAESKYDTFNFGNTNSLQANTKYTRIKINELHENLNLDAGYGGINVRKVDNTFKSVNITSSYGQIALGLNGADYSLEANCSYCGVSYPEERFSGDRISENHSRIVKGKVGTPSGGEVYIKSRYGEIKLD
jgi:hypothetical protein